MKYRYRYQHLIIVVLIESTFYYWNPAWVLFLLLVEWYVLAIIVPFAPQIKEQVRQIKNSSD